MFEERIADYIGDMTSLDSPAGAFAPSPTGAKKAARGWTAAWRIAAFIVLFVAGSFAAGFGIFASHVADMVTPRKQASADAIIVLTGGQARLDAAVDLLRSGKGERLLISGVNPSTGRNQLRAAIGANSNLFNCCVDFDYEALDTVGNAAESAKWLKAHNYDSAILVTNNYHMPRSLLELGRRTGAELKPYPVVNTPLDHGRWMVEPDALRVLMTEYAKYVAALVLSLGPDDAQPAAVNVASGPSVSG